MRKRLVFVLVPLSLLLAGTAHAQGETYTLANPQAATSLPECIGGGVEHMHMHFVLTQVTPGEGGATIKIKLSGPIINRTMPMSLNGVSEWGATFNFHHQASRGLPESIADGTTTVMARVITGDVTEGPNPQLLLSVDSSCWC